ncbi:glycosyltransferase [Candidatus Peregrinibacteria bacterium]|nr:glycosyltransferase [Candidatus Peregrinibacteria bacterium]
MSNSKVGLAVPTYNAEPYLDAWIKSLKMQSFCPHRILAIDSESKDGTRDICTQQNFEVHRIKQRDFDHGGTRQLAVELLDDCDILVFMTQDAIMSSSDSLSNLLAPFDNPETAAVCGRQLPSKDAGPIAAHARLFNYADSNQVKTKNDISKFGFKTIFLSDSFAAYRRNTLLNAGGFPKRSIFGEDTVVAAKLILAGYSIAYRSDASVYHSHNYSLFEEFNRYFDIGVLHNRESWLREEFGGAEGEGKRFVLSELKYLTHTAPLLIPSALLRTFAKLGGYKLGMNERRLSVNSKRALSMNRRFWIDEIEAGKLESHLPNRERKTKNV